MKYPQLIVIEEALQDLSRFDAIIDVRSENEFALDHIPGAINCPVLDNQERIKVGTCYKQIGAFEAKKMGAAIVARNIANHLEHLFHEKPREWRPLIYCWRGGNRSGSMATIFAKIGWPVAQLDGGYKEFRRQVNHTLEVLPEHFTWKVISGPTGSCKSKLLQALEKMGAQILDLEKFASHRGSVLGDLPSQTQPSQKQFETQIWNALRAFKPDTPIFVEAESKKIGQLRVPEMLMAAIRDGDCLNIEMSIEARIAFLCDDYAHYVTSTEKLLHQLSYLLPLHGKEKIQHWSELASTGRIQDLVRELLIEHYDPAYQKSVMRNFKRAGEAQNFILKSHHPEDIILVAKNILSHDT